MSNTFTVRSRFEPGDLDGLIARIRGAAHRGVQKAALAVETSAKMYCPVLTGTLRRSIQSEVNREGPVITALIGPQVDYGPYVEFGTGERGASSGQGGPGPYDTSRPGQVPQPYMRPAFEEHKHIAPQIVTEEIRGEL